MKTKFFLWCLLSLSIFIYWCTKSPQIDNINNIEDNKIQNKTETLIQNSNNIIKTWQEDPVQSWKTENINNQNHSDSQNKDKTWDTAINNLVEYSKWGQFDEDWVDLLYQLIDSIK